jgi:hypothetical protein
MYPISIVEFSTTDGKNFKHFAGGSFELAGILTRICVIFALLRYYGELIISYRRFGIPYRSHLQG